MKLAKTGTSLWNTGLKTLWSTLDSARSMIGGTTQTSAGGSAHGASPDHVHDSGLDLGGESGAVPSAAVPMSVDGVEYKQGEPSSEVAESSEGSGMWGRFPCCISCVSHLPHPLRTSCPKHPLIPQTTTDYFQAENFSGVGQEHLICLNRGPVDTGHIWLEQTITTLATKLQTAGMDRPGTEKGLPLIDVDVWWGWEDNMVPRKGQLWFNKTLGRYPREMRLKVHDVPDGDHTDL